MIIIVFHNIPQQILGKVEKHHYYFLSKGQKFRSGARPPSAPNGLVGVKIYVALLQKENGSITKNTVEVEKNNFFLLLLPYFTYFTYLPKFADSIFR